MSRARILLALAVVAGLAAVAYALTRGDRTPRADDAHNGGRATAHAAVEPKTLERVPMPGLQYDDDPPGDQRLEGQVIDADEQPVAGATVVIDANPPREVTTEEDGSFALDGLNPRTYQLEARAGDAVAGPVAVKVSRSSDPVVLRLVRAAQIVVDVRGGSDAAVAGALVELRDLAAITATTGDDGRATLRGVGAGWHVVKASAPGYAAEFQEVTTSGEPGDEQVVTVRLRAGVTVAGTVIDSAGAPIEGARVMPEGVARMDDLHDARLDGVVTDAKGRWRLTGLPRETLRVRAYHPSYAPGWTAPVPLGDGVERDDLMIVLERGARVRGRVVDAGGAPVPGAEVRVSADDLRAGPVRRAACDAEGRFEFTGLSRRVVRLIALSEESSSAMATVDLARAAGDDIELRLDLEDAIAGIVVTSSGEPVGEARVVATPPLGEDTQARFTRRLRGPGTAIADGDGHFRISGLPKGPYLVRAVRPGARSELLEMRQGAKIETGSTDAHIVVDDLAVLTGKVAYADGSAPREIAVKLGGAPPRSFAGDTFRFEGVPAGKQYLVIDGPELMEEERTDVEITAEGVTDLGTIEVQRGRRISGVVVDGDGAPVAGAMVVAARDLRADGTQLLPYPQPSEQTVTDRDGHFELRGVAPFQQVLVADHDTKGRSAVQILPAGTSDSTTSLALAPTGALDGFVRVDGRPATAFIVMRPASGGNASFAVETGPDGSYRLDRLGAGRYMLYAGLVRGDRLGEDGTSLTIDIVSDKVTTRDVELVGSGIEVTVHIKSAGDAVEFGYAAIASLPRDAEVAAPHNITEGRQILIALGESASREGLIVKDRAITFSHVKPGRNIACISPLRGDPSDPTVLAELEHSVLDWPLYCDFFDFPASPEHVDVSIEVQPLQP